MIRSQDSFVDNNIKGTANVHSSTSVVSNSNKNAYKNNSTRDVKKKANHSKNASANFNKKNLKSSKKSSYRKSYKKLKYKLKDLLEEGAVLKKRLKRKQEQLVEMSRDIHYILGRLLPYEKKLGTNIDSSNMLTCNSSTSIMNTHIDCPSTSSSSIASTNNSSQASLSSQQLLSSLNSVESSAIDGQIKTEDHCESSTSNSTWDGITCPSNVLGKSQMNFSLPPEYTTVECQLASIVADRPSLVLPDDIFSES